MEQELRDPRAVLRLKVVAVEKHLCNKFTVIGGIVTK